MQSAEMPNESGPDFPPSLLPDVPVPVKNEQSALIADARLAAFDRAIRAMTTGLPVEQVLQLIADQARLLVGARYSALGIVDDQGGIERFVASGISAAAHARIGAPPRGQGILGMIIAQNRSYRIEDLVTHPQSAGFPAHHPVMHAFLGVPVSVRGKTIGNLYLAEKEGGFEAADQRLVELFAGHAAIAMENARLRERIAVLAIIEERERISRELHDGVIQSIYGVSLSLEMLPELLRESPETADLRIERAIESLDRTIRDIRSFIFGLRPQLLAGASLAEGLTILANEFRVNNMSDLELVLDPPLSSFPLNPEQTAELLAVVREALSNVSRHARASRVEIRVSIIEPPLESPADRSPAVPTLSLLVADNGCGFDQTAARGRGHLGLANMRARINDIGGRLVIKSRRSESAPSRGTRLLVLLPLTSGGLPTEPSSGDEYHDN